MFHEPAHFDRIISLTDGSSYGDEGRSSAGNGFFVARRMHTRVSLRGSIAIHSHGEPNPCCVVQHSSLAGPSDKGVRRLASDCVIAPSGCTSLRYRPRFGIDLGAAPTNMGDLTLPILGALSIVILAAGVIAYTRSRKRKTQ